MEKFLKDNSNSNNSPVTSHSTNYFTENTDDKGNAGIKDNDEKMSGPIFDNLFSEEPKDINLYKYNPNLFIDNNSENKNFIQSKRGREKKKKNKKKTHEKDSKDNIRRKIKTHFFDFIIEHVNKKLKEVNELKQIVFLPISYKEKEKSTKKGFKEHFERNIGDILQLNVLGSIKEKEYNLKLYKILQLEKKEEFEDILKMKTHKFYKDIFLSSDYFKKDINLLLNKDYSEDYVEKYISLANDLLNFIEIKEENDIVNKFKEDSENDIINDIFENGFNFDCISHESNEESIFHYISGH